MSGLPKISGRVITISDNPVRGVLVSNGRHVVTTDADGRFEIPAPDGVTGTLPEPQRERERGVNPSRGSRWVYITTPSGYRPADGPFNWFRDITAWNDEELTFRLTPDERRAGGSFTAAIQSDAHLGKYPFSWLADDLDAMAEDESGPDCIICTGDMTQSGEPKELHDYLHTCAGSRLPVIHVPGNHEWSSDRNGENWSQIVGPHYFSLDWGPVHLIAYDSTSSLYTEAYPIDEWLQNDLAHVPHDKPVVLLIHHQRDEAFYAPLRHRRIVASVSGHWHSSRIYDDGHTLHCNQPSSTMGGIDYSARGYSVVSVSASGDVELKRRLLGAGSRGKQTGIISIPELPPVVVTNPRPTPLPNDSWPQFHGGPDRNGSASENVTFPLNRLWQMKLPGGLLFGSPVVSKSETGHRVIIPSLDEEHGNSGWLTCHDIHDGTPLWQIPTGGSVKHSAVINDNLVYAVNVTGRVMAVSLEDGSPVWEYQLGDPSERWMFSAPVLKNGRLITGASQHLACLDAATGKPHWVRDDFNGTDWISSYVSPAADEDTVYMGFFWHHEAVIALDMKTGETLWTADDPTRIGPVSSYVVGKEDSLYITCHDGTVRKYHRSDGSEIWRAGLGQEKDRRGGPKWSAGTPALTDGKLFIPSGGGGLHAVDAESGAELWRWEAEPALAGIQAYERDGASVLSSPVVTGTHVMVGSSDGRLVALDAETGELRWEDEIGAPVVSSPAVSGNVVICGASDGWLYAWASE